MPEDRHDSLGNSLSSRNPDVLCTQWIRIKAVFLQAMSDHKGAQTFTRCEKIVHSRLIFWMLCQQTQGIFEIVENHRKTDVHFFDVSRPGAKRRCCLDKSCTNRPAYRGSFAARYNRSVVPHKAETTRIACSSPRITSAIFSMSSGSRRHEPPNL